jgi:flagellar hook-associated protein 1 FlgK
MADRARARAGRSGRVPMRRSGKEASLGTLFSALDIARSGLYVSQAQIDATAHNIANVNTPGFSRQRAEISARMPVTYPFGDLGRGVQIDGISRLRDSFLDAAYRLQSPNLGSSNIQNQYFARIEDLFLEPTEFGFSTRMNGFFDALNDFAGQVDSMAARESVLAEARSLADNLRQLSGRLYDLRTSANDHVRDLVPEINNLTTQIATLNERIRYQQGTGSQAPDLRDQRDLLLDRLSEFVNISTREREDGQVDVLVGSQELVTGASARQLVAVRNGALDPERDDLVEVRFADNEQLLEVESGELQGILHIRDEVIAAVDRRLDTMAAAFIREMNAIQSQGRGLKPFSGSMHSLNAVTDPNAPLGTQGLPFGIKPGTVDLRISDANGNTTTNTLIIDGNTSLATLAAQMSSAANFVAIVDDGILEMTAAPGYSFQFANDTTGVLGALGINTLFTGTDARTIGVNAFLAENPIYLTSGYSADPLNTGDNSAALEMVGLRGKLVLENGTTSINGFYEATIARLGVEARANSQTLEIESAFVDDLDRRRKEVSGVSLDEEVTYLIQFERAFEASARVITVVDRMLETLLNTAL